MSDEVEVEVTKRKRGRPRSIDTIARDKVTLAFLLEHRDPVTKRDVASHLNVSQNMAYLSLCRLRAEGLARRHNNSWTTYKNVQP